jgi:hypothetical protein
MQPYYHTEKILEIHNLTFTEEKFKISKGILKFYLTGDIKFKWIYIPMSFKVTPNLEYLTEIF